MGESQTKEINFEQLIEKALVGSCKEEREQLALSNPAANDVLLQHPDDKHYYFGSTKHFDKDKALDVERLFSFLRSSNQLKEEQANCETFKRDLLSRLNNVIAKFGLLYVLRNGIEVNGIKLNLFYPKPSAFDSESAHHNYLKNQFSITRQVKFAYDKQDSVDMVLFVNGLPIFSMELKNPWTGQSAREHGQRQYRFSRSDKDTLFKFGRCIAHFTLDKNEVFFTTKLAGKSTVFMPFNLGQPNGQGAGNPPSDKGYRTAYFWEEVLQKDVLSDILLNYVSFDFGKSGHKHAIELKYASKLIFPRYHQLDVVNKLTSDVAAYGVGKTYLIEHSAGSGKSNSITWLAFKLLDLCPSSLQAQGSHGLNNKLFKSVIVVTDRRLLDQQLTSNIKAFSSVNNIVQHVDSSNELQAALEKGKRLITTTIQKFPFVYAAIKDLSGNNFAVIIDEAHSSQSGSAADKLNASLQKSNEDSSSYQSATEALLFELCAGRKMNTNCSYFAFTATPKKETLERFGTKDSDGSYRPFHLYSMKQAIEEGFILDVLSNYTTYRSYYEIIKSIEGNPDYNKDQAQKLLKRYVERDDSAIAAKAQVMLDHFVQKVQPKLHGKAKAMVVTKDIECAVRYFKTLQQLAQERKVGFKLAVAFTGEKTVDGIECSEKKLNGFEGVDITKNFATDEYRILVVANKYLTGFDEPKLCAMYVDKPLCGVLAVQALSRLNRAAPALGKISEALFVLDFYNSVEDIKKSFEPFYTSIYLTEGSDINLLLDLKSVLLGFGVFYQQELDDFINLYLKGASAEDLAPLIDRAVERFEHELELDDLAKQDFKLKCKQFVRSYSRMAAIIESNLLECEKLFWFLRFLIPELVVKTKNDDVSDLLDSIDLNTYGLRCVALNQTIELDGNGSEVKPDDQNIISAKEKEDPMDSLDNIIRAFNEHFFAGWEGNSDEYNEVLFNLSKNVVNLDQYQDAVLSNEDKEEAQNMVNKFITQSVRQLKNTSPIYEETYKRYMSTEDGDEFKRALVAVVSNIIAQYPHESLLQEAMKRYYMRASKR